MGFALSGSATINVKSMKKIILLACVLVALGACRENRRTVTTAEEVEVITIPVRPADTHNSQNSLDWAGTYEGTLPCADCEGIKTELTLANDGNYVLKTQYLGKGDGEVYEIKGTFAWNDAGNTITLCANDIPNQYFVGENVLYHLDIDGNRIEGDLADNYKLMKK